MSVPILYAHQISAVDFLRSRGFTGAVFADAGTGKTLMALEAFRALQGLLGATEGIKMVVCAPLSLLEAAWGQDIRNFTTFSYYNAHDKPLPDVLKEDILLINYDAVITKRAAKIINLVKGNLLVCDESGRMKNNQSKTTKTMLLIGRLAQYRIVMTATPAPNSPLEYWGQIEFLKPRYLHMSGSFYAFRNSYFHLQRGSQIFHGQHVTRAALMDAFRTGFKYEITQKNLEKLMARINPLAYRIRKEECLDLPEQVDEIRKIILSSQQMKHYKEMKDYLITEIKGKMVTAEIAMTKILKLQEIVSGFCFDAQGKILEIKNGDIKYDELLELLEEIGDKQVIIWCRFQYEIRKILSLLSNSCTLYGETKNKLDSINGFKEGRYKYMIAHVRSAGHGLTFVNCSYMVYFSLDFSWEGMLQSRSRIHRIGQINKCTYIYLLGKDTIEEDIYKALMEKQKLQEFIDDFIKRNTE